MKKLLFAAAALVALALPAKADVVVNLGTNPDSGAGAFANTDPGSVPAINPLNGLGGAFIDIYNFSLTFDQTLTIAFATNTFAGGTIQEILNFTGAVVYEGADGQIGGGDDQVVLGPELATACIMIPNCQVFGGSAVLNSGEYHLRITGFAGDASGYGGNLSTFGVPGPAVGAGIPGIVAAFGLGLAWYRRRKAA